MLYAATSSADGVPSAAPGRTDTSQPAEGSHLAERGKSRGQAGHDSAVPQREAAGVPLEHSTADARGKPADRDAGLLAQVMQQQRQHVHASAVGTAPVAAAGAARPDGEAEAAAASQQQGTIDVPALVPCRARSPASAEQPASGDASAHASALQGCAVALSMPHALVPPAPGAATSGAASVPLHERTGGAALHAPQVPRYAGLPASQYSQTPYNLADNTNLAQHHISPQAALLARERAPHDLAHSMRYGSGAHAPALAAHHGKHMLKMERGDGGTRSTGSARAVRSAAAGEFKSCNCRQSRCLKLYCECFASGRYCSGCNCHNCRNNKDYEAERSAAIEAILDRNPTAFRPKIQFQAVEGGQAQEVTRHSKGCSCRKSNCLKKYCECFQAGIFCARTCRCRDCQNYEGSEALTTMMENTEGGAGARAAQGGGTDGKRHRFAKAHSGAPHATPPVHHYVPKKKDPARDAIKHSRDKRMHEVLASMLTTLHVEAYSKEKRAHPDPGTFAGGKRELEGASDDGAGKCALTAAAKAAAAHERTPKADAHLSDYYVRTEGTLLSEFGHFLGKLADRIDEQATKHTRPTP